MFMSITKKLHNMLQKPTSNDENNNPNGSSFGNSRKNKDLENMGSPQTMKQQ
jgi:hypothetical protein